MSRYIKVLFCLLSSLFCSCSFSSEQNIYDIQTTDYGLIYGISNCIYKDYQETFDIQNILEEHLKAYYPNDNAKFLINYCSTKNNNIYSNTIVHINDSITYSFDFIIKNTKTLQHIGSINQKEVIQKFSLSDQDYLLTEYFNCRTGLADDYNPDFLMSVPGKSIYEHFDFEIVFDRNTFEMISFDKKSDSFNEEDVCLRRTGATIVVAEENTVPVPALNIGGEIYTFDSAYLSRHSDFYPSIESSLFTRSHFSKKFLRFDDSIYLVIIPYRDDFTELDNLIYKLDIKQKFAHYIGFVPASNNLKGAIRL